MYLYQFPRFGIQALFFLPRCIGISRCHDVLYLMVLKSFRKRSLTLLPSGFCCWNRTGYKAAASIKAAIVPLRFWHAGPSPTQVRPTFERSLVLCLSFSFSFALCCSHCVFRTVGQPLLMGEPASDDSRVSAGNRTLCLLLSSVRACVNPLRQICTLLSI